MKQAKLVGTGIQGGGYQEVFLDGLNVRRKGDSSVLKYRAITGFTFLQDFQNGLYSKLDEFMSRCREYGVNTIRVFTVWNNTKYSPKNSELYYVNVNLAAQYARQHGFFLHVVGLCDMKPSNPDVYMNYDQQVDHLEQLVDIGREVGNFLPFEISNEDTDGDSGGTAGFFPKSMFDGLIATRSTWFDDENPQLPDQNGNPSEYLSAMSVHTPRGPEFFVKGKVLYESQRQGLGQYPATRLWTVSGEPQRIAEGTTPRMHADNAAVCELFGGGGLVHGGFRSFDGNHETDLQNCVAPERGSNGDKCILGVSDVWASGLIHPEAAGRGRYTRGGLEDCPIVHVDHTVDGQKGAVRTYCMEYEGKMYTVVCGPMPQWQAQPVNGWRITARGGYMGDGLGGNILVLER